MEAHGMRRVRMPMRIYLANPLKRFCEALYGDRK